MSYERDGKWWFSLYDPQAPNQQREFGPYENKDQADVSEVEADAMWDV